MSNIDKPNYVEFSKAIAQNLPTQADSSRLFNHAAIGYILGKAIKYATKR